MTEVWLVRQLRQLDWVTRHHHMLGFRIYRPSLHAKVCCLMTPDELIDGTGGAKMMRSCVTIISKNKRKQLKQKQLKQTTLHRYFFYIRK